MVVISAEIEIQASPEAVRTVVSYHALLVSCPYSSVPETRSHELKAGDQLQVDLNGMKFSPVVLDNSAERFQWEGKLEPIFSGKHEFKFAPSTKTPGATTFTQTEEFRGLLSFLMRPGWSFSNSTLANWEAFNKELKEEAEKSAVQE